MEVLVEYNNGSRLTATCNGHKVTTGKGEDEDTAADGMWPAQLFVAALGMCIGGYVTSFCQHHGILCQDLRIELSRETARAPSRTARVHVKIHLGAKMSPKEVQAILRVADRCHITKSIDEGMDVVCSVIANALPDPQAP